MKNGKVASNANFKPDRGNYTKDGNLITSKVGIYGANSNGLYDMAGNGCRVDKYLSIQRLVSMR